MPKSEKVIRNVKSITLSDEHDISSTHYQSKKMWSSLKIKLNDGEEIEIHPCNCGGLREGKEDVE